MLIEFKNVVKTYGKTNLTYALNDVSFTIDDGEFVVILGPSGAGKSTILNILGGMDNLTSGSVICDNEVITNYNDAQRTIYRANKIGFVFQFYNLIPTLTVYENVNMIKQVKHDTLNAKEVLESVGLGDKLSKFPEELSGGEQQRVSLARALMKNSKILLCDEPTGALDSKTGVKILEALKDMQKQGKTVIIVTHNQNIAAIADKVIRVKNGLISNIDINTPKQVNEVEW